LVVTPGAASQGTVAPGAAVIAPMFVRIHCAHRSKGIGGVPTVPLPPVRSSPISIPSSG
jgi:hypothetical protein